MEYKDIIAKLQELNYEVEDLGEGCLPNNIEGIGSVECVSSYGGEDCGSTYYTVYHFKDHDIYIRTDGWYQSHYGVEFEGWDSACSEVRPQVKQITVFE